MKWMSPEGKEIESHPFYYSVNYKGDLYAWVNSILIYQHIPLHNFAGLFPQRKEVFLLRIEDDRNPNQGFIHKILALMFS